MWGARSAQQHQVFQLYLHRLGDFTQLHSARSSIPAQTTQQREKACKYQAANPDCMLTGRPRETCLQISVEYVRAHQFALALSTMLTEACLQPRGVFVNS